jgi:hypothetical protein
VVDLSSLESDPTLEEAKRIAVLENSQQPVRDYLGASQIGHLCERAIWYSFNGYEEKEKTAKGVFAIEDGHRTEELVVERLNKVSGVKVHSRQNGFTDFDGKFKGHIDGIIDGLLQAPKTSHLFEVKCCNEDKFKKLDKEKRERGEKSALEHWDIVYYAQAQIYMLKMGLDRHYLVCALPGGRDMISVRTDLNTERANGYLKRAHRVINATFAPDRVAENSDFYICKFCNFKAECWK